MRRFALLTVALVVSGSALPTAQLTTPADWKWRQDVAAPLASGAAMAPGSWVFVQMPPGWHVTTGPGVPLYPTAHGDVAGNFSIEADIFLFPGESQEEYRLFLGGQDIDTAGTPDYSAFVLRRDGQAAVLRWQAGQATVVEKWQRHESIVPHTGAKDAIKNTIRVEADPQTATMLVNGGKVLSIPRSAVRLDGRLGFRVGKDLNLHIATLNVTRKLAPVPAPKANPADKKD